MILCDTNILIEIYRGNTDIVQLLKKVGQQDVAVSDVTRAELFWGARNKKELQTLRKDLSSLTTFPINIEVSNLAVELVNTFCLSHKLTLPDALIAATAIVYDVELMTLNTKDFIFIKELKLYTFK